MKDLKTHLLEAIRPPRLSAKNRELWKGATEAAIMKWLEKNCWIKGKVKILDGKINVDGDVVVSRDIEYLPYPFGRVTGYFNCSYSNLITLKNCPEYVGGDFDCWMCPNLTSLEGAPEKVGGEFDCRGCTIRFTEADVRKVSDVKGKIIASKI